MYCLFGYTADHAPYTLASPHAAASPAHYALWQRVCARRQTSLPETLETRLFKQLDPQGICSLVPSRNKIRTRRWVDMINGNRECLKKPHFLAGKISVQFHAWCYLKHNMERPVGSFEGNSLGISVILGEFLVWRMIECCTLSKPDRFWLGRAALEWQKMSTFQKRNTGPSPPWFN